MSNNVSVLSLASNEFGRNLFKTLPKSSNLLLSPFCLHNVLSMAYFGADGQTKYEMKKVLKLDFLKDEELQAAYTSITSSDKPRSTTLANRIYLEQTATILDSFKKICTKNFNSDSVSVNFQNSSAAESIINKWVEDVTKGKIKDVIRSGALTLDTFMVLVNTVYFKGKWDVPFDSANTNQGPFCITNDEKVQVEFMQRKGKFKVGYSDELRCSALEIPYENNDYVMTIFLPNEIDDLKYLESSLNSGALDKLTETMNMEQVQLSLPKFSMSFSTSLRQVLNDLGMESPFIAGKADFCGIDGTRNLHIANVFHKTFIEINEEGTEAGASGAVSMASRMLPVPFFVDRPFLFNIKDSASNIILFQGRIVNPSVL